MPRTVDELAQGLLRDGAIVGDREPIDGQVLGAAIVIALSKASSDRSCLKLTGVAVSNDLAVWRASEDWLPGLSFERCEFFGALILDDLRLRRLELTDCAIRRMFARGCAVRGNAVFVRSGAAHDESAARIDLQASSVEGSVIFRTVRLRYDTTSEGTGDELLWGGRPSRSAIDLECAVIGRNLVLDGGGDMSCVRGGVFAQRLRVGGSVHIGNADLSASILDPDSQTRAPYVLDLRDATVGVAINVHRSTFFGRIHCSGATIGSGITFSETNVTTDDPHAIAVAAQRMRVGADVKVQAGSAITGGCSFAGSSIGGLLALHDSVLDLHEGVRNFVLNAEGVHAANVAMGSSDSSRLAASPNAHAIAFSRSEADEPAARSAPAAGMRFGGDVTCANLHVTKNLAVAGVRFLTATPAAASPDDDILFDLQAVIVDGILLMMGLSSAGRVKLSLQSAKVGVLSDTIEEGWGDPPRRVNGRRVGVQLLLEGFQYGALSAKASELVAKKRAEWLRRQYEDLTPEPATFRTQPLAQLASAFEAMGDTEKARTTIIESLNQKPTNCFRTVLKRLFGCCFGHGYDPRRALVTLVLFWAVGYGLTSAAKHLNLFVHDVLPAATLAGDIASPATGAATPRALEFFVVAASPEQRVSVNDISCRDSVNAALYALDLMLPLVGLNEANRCVLRDSGTIGFVARMTRALYIGFGWLIVSISVLTFSGVFRRRLE